MTREEAIKIFNTVLFFGKCDCPKEEIEECLKMAIKALEQEPVLDKIKAEIDKAWCTKPKNRYEEGLKDQALKDIQIIDRYKAEVRNK